MISLFKLRKNYLITGRGATAIFLCLKNEHITNAEVIVPANICYAAVYPIIYSGNNPIFCDVNEKTGNVSIDQIKKFVSSKTKAILVPHMYGNVNTNISSIRKWCDKKNIILIEDCASIYPDENSEYMIGSRGHYTIFSFGYSKIVDIGYGGMLCTDKDLRIAKDELDKLPEINDRIKDEEAHFSKMYRKVRNGDMDYNQIKRIINKDLFLYKITNHNIKSVLSNEEFIDKTIDKRCRNYKLYKEKMNYKNTYHYVKGSTPWRYSIFVQDEHIRQEIIDRLLSNNLPVSDWYPNVTKFFSLSGKKMLRTDKMEKEILNFPLDVDEQTINNICFAVNNIVDRQKESIC